MHLNAGVDRFISIIRAFRKHRIRGCSVRINLIGRDARIIQSARLLRLVIVSVGKDFVHETVYRWYLKAVQPCLGGKARSFRPTASPEIGNGYEIRLRIKIRIKETKFEFGLLTKLQIECRFQT